MPDQLAYLLNYAVLAPSAHNAQPWRFRIDDRMVSFFKDVSRNRAIADPHGRETTIAVGAALLTFQVAISRFGIRHRVEIHDAGNPVALVVAGEGPVESYDPALFAGIVQRVTCRMGFDETPIPADLQKAMALDADVEGANLSLVLGDESKSSLAALIAEADRVQFSDSQFRQEHAKWVRNADAHDQVGTADEGAAGFFSTMFRSLGSGGSRAAKDEKLATDAPLLGVISTPGDDQDDWIKAGCALQRVLIRAAAAGFSSSMLNQPVEVASMRPAVSSAVGRRDYAQLIFRMGRAPRDIPHAPRRPVGEVLDA